jgi:hypothetical protein
MAGLSAATRPVGPVFEVEFAGGGTDGAARPLGELQGQAVRAGGPVRSFPSPGRSELSRQYYAATMDAHVGFSRLGVTWR